MNILVVGLGHEMHGDDESGLEIVRRWVEISGEQYPAVQTVLLDNPGLNLLGLIAGRDAAILVAATRVGAPLGTVQIFQDLELSEIPEQSRKGGGWGAAETLSLGRQLAPEELPERLILIGVEGGAFGLGEGLSPAVRGAIPAAVKEIDQALDRIRGGKLSIKRIWGRFRDTLKKKPASSN